MEDEHMDSMENFRERLEGLEQQTKAMAAKTHMVGRRLRWWRGLACGLAVVGLLGWGLPLGLAREDAPDKEKGEKGLAQRVAALEKLLKHFSREKNEIFITGANLRIVNGLGATETTNGLGNLIVGYNEPRPEGGDRRTGAHNVIVGQQRDFTRFGGLVVGFKNMISGTYASVSAGAFNAARGDWSSVSGGASNEANDVYTSISGGTANIANGLAASITAGFHNITMADYASITGGGNNLASGIEATVSGGEQNTASGNFSTVSGGRSITQETENGWSAGSEVDEVVVGNFRSP
jgi:hypothetical protein